jgi:hypothetical protein
MKGAPDREVRDQKKLHEALEGHREGEAVPKLERSDAQHGPKVASKALG